MERIYIYRGLYTGSQPHFQSYSLQIPSINYQINVIIIKVIKSWLT